MSGAKKIITFETGLPEMSCRKYIDKIRKCLIFDLDYVGHTILKNPAIQSIEIERYSQINFKTRVSEPDNIFELKFSSISDISSKMKDIIPPIPEIDKDGSLILDIFFDGKFIDRREFPNPEEYFENLCSAYKEDEDLSEEESSKIIKEMLGEKVLKAIRKSTSCSSCC